MSRHYQDAMITVGCRVRSGISIPLLDLYRLALKNGHRLSSLLPDLVPEKLGDVSNPVISSDVSLVAFQTTAPSDSEYLEDPGIYFARLSR